MRATASPKPDATPAPLPIAVTDDLTVALGGKAITLTPSQGLDFAEQLARASFRRALTEEAFALTGDDFR